MKDQKKKAEREDLSKYTGEHHGPQGVDKAPDEEVSTGNDNFIQWSQKAKQKIDPDPDEEK